MIRLPVALQHEWGHEREWLAALPRLVADCAADWSLVLEEPVETPHSLVVPAGDVVLKLNAPSHFEAEQEADALAAWAGRGAVRLVARADERRALLVERCRPGTHLSSSGADGPEVLVKLLPQLSLEPEAGHPFGRLADEADRWADEVPTRYELAGRPFERSLLDRALEVYASVDRTAMALVNQDLHGDNVLRASREPWLVIDPKPLVGERELDGVGLLRNVGEVDGAAEVRHWLARLGELGLDRGRLRDWGLAHALAWGTDADGSWSEWSIHVARTIAAA